MAKDDKTIINPIKGDYVRAFTELVARYGAVEYKEVNCINYKILPRKFWKAYEKYKRKQSDSQ